MAFKPRKDPNEPVDVDRLQSILNQTDTPAKNNPLYQFLNTLIANISKIQSGLQTQITDVKTLVPGGGTTPITPPGTFAPADADFITWSDETADLPNSRNLIAGTGITFDDSVANERTIISNEAFHYDAPLSDGDLVEADLIFAAGECIIVQVPIP